MWLSTGYLDQRGFPDPRGGGGIIDQYLSIAVPLRSETQTLFRTKEMKIPMLYRATQLKTIYSIYSSRSLLGIQRKSP